MLTKITGVVPSSICGIRNLRMPPAAVAVFRWKQKDQHLLQTKHRTNILETNVFLKWIDMVKCHCTCHNDKKWITNDFLGVQLVILQRLATIETTNSLGIKNEEMLDTKS